MRPEERMRKSHFLILLWLSVCGSAFTDAQAQLPLYSCSRSTIEAYPEEEKRPVLQFLDEARALADKSARLFAEGRVNELYAVMSTPFKNDYTEATFPEFLAAQEQMLGKILKYEYRNQSLSFGNPEEIDLQSSGSGVIYEVKTTSGNDDVYLDVQTGQERKEPVVVNITLRRFGPAYPPERRYRQVKESACLFIKGPLKVKASR
jgi:hypothetical protein